MGQKTVGPNQSKSPSDQKPSPDGKNNSISIPCDDNDTLECFLNHPAVTTEERPFAPDCKSVAEAQNHDAASLQSFASKPSSFSRFPMNQEANLICCAPGPNPPFKTRIPDAMTDNITRFCHLALNCKCMTLLCDTIALHFYHPRSQLCVKRVVRPCDACQRHKQIGRGHGHLGARAALLAPWEAASVTDNRSTVRWSSENFELAR